MAGEQSEPSFVELMEAADRLEALAEVAELMSDLDGAARFRARASQHRLQAMAQLDD